METKDNPGQETTIYNAGFSAELSLGGGGGGGAGRGEFFLNEF